MLISNPIHNLLATDPINRRMPFTHAHSVLLWPATMRMLSTCSSAVLDPLQSLQFNEISWLMKLQEPTWDKNSLGYRFTAPTSPLANQGGSLAPFNYLVGLSNEDIQQFANYYFNTFNYMYPFMDREWFFTNTLPKAMGDLKQAEFETTITLLVLALGKLGYEGATGIPVTQIDQYTSGVRGGTADLPPGVSLFDKARQRLGFVATSYTLESIHIFSLVAIYFGQCCRHLDFWRAATAASQACQLLLSKEPITWSSPEGDQIACTYWHCVIIENELHYELGLPQSGIDRFEDEVPFPTFIGNSHPTDIVADDFCHYRMHFLSQIALCRVWGNIRMTLHAKNYSPTAKTAHFDEPQPLLVQEMVRQADMWRGSLPTPIQWTDDAPSDQNFKLQQLQQNFWPTSPTGSLLPNRSSSALNKYRSPFPGEVIHPILNAWTRTRFYHMRYSIYRSYIFKVLHFPERASADDIEKCVLCLKAACYWPVYMYPASDCKRLSPYHFCWSQTLLSILLIFHLTSRYPLLRNIKDQYFTNNEIEDTIALIVNWMRDMRDIDRVAKWGWEILSQLRKC